MKGPLNGQVFVWLHVFSCAARHLSFTRCAEELHITPGAVSQQMRLLEERLGFRLFLRRARGVELTAEGQRLAQTVAEAYGGIEAELLRLDAGEIRGTLRLRSIPSFLAKWLTPRLPRFQQRYPDIALRLVAEDSNQALHPEDFDLAIDLNDGSYPGMLSTPLLDEQIFPVCSPALLRGARPCMGQRTWCTIRCCTTSLPGAAVRNTPSGSSTWRIGAQGLDVRRGHTFNRNHLTIEAAIAGVGVAIARRTLLNDELERGALIVPFGVPIANHKRYVLLYQPGGLNQPGARAVHDWLVEEAQGFRALHLLSEVMAPC